MVFTNDTEVALQSAANLINTAPATLDAEGILTGRTPW